MCSSVQPRSLVAGSQMPALRTDSAHRIRKPQTTATQRNAQAYTSACTAAAAARHSHSCLDRDHA